jgi:coproporphyrinogen III oxidase-like Fe-S oxidoreductase
LPDRLNLYLHVPFCTQRCAYCIYHSEAAPADDTVDVYLARLLQEMDYYGEALQGVGVGAGYLGGGTPTVLSPTQLERLLRRLRGRFRSRAGALWAFECNPLTATEDKVRLLSDHGFNRVSFGVQSLSASVLQRVRRGYQTEALVFEVLERMRRHRLWINVDLIHGLPQEGPRDVVDTVDRLLRHQVTQIEIYLLSPYTPRGTRRDPQRILSVAELAARVRDRVAEAGARVLEFDTSVVVLASAPVVADNRLSEQRAAAGVEYVYDDVSCDPVSLLGLGPTARSRIYGRLVYQQEAHAPRAPFEPAVPGPRGRAVSGREEEQRFVTYHLGRPEGLRVDRFAQRFGKSLRRSFGRELRALRELELLEETAERIRLRPRDPAERFAALLFFVDPAALRAAEDEARGRGAREPEGPGEAHPARDPAPRGEGRSHEASPDEPEVALEVGAGPVRLRVTVVGRRPGQGAYQVAGDWACYVPREGTDGEAAAALTPDQERCLRVFCAVFRRVVRGRRPRSLPELVEALEAFVSTRGARSWEALKITRCGTLPDGRSEGG